MASVTLTPVVEMSLALTVARDNRLSADDLRTLLAVSVLASQRDDDDIPLADLAELTGLSPATNRGAIFALVSAGYLSLTANELGTWRAAMLAPRAGMAPDRPKPAKGRGLDARIMEDEIDLERLKRIGDHLKRIGDASAHDTAALRDARAAGRSNRPSRGLAEWNPVDDEAGQPVAVRFSIWLRFVLTPDELDTCELWSAAHPEEWMKWASQFAKAKAAGDDKELLKALRLRLCEIATAPPIPGDPGSPSMGPAD